MENWNHLPSSKMFLLFLYLPIISLSGLLSLANHSEFHAASWPYYSSPLKQPGYVIRGALKALVTKFFFPLYLLIVVFCLYVWGVAVLDDVFLGLMGNLFILFLAGRLQPHYLPFSLEQNGCLSQCDRRRSRARFSQFFNSELRSRSVCL